MSPSPPRLRLALGLFTPLLTACGGLSLNQVVALDLPAEDGLVCASYLGWNGPSAEHVILMMNGTGTYSSAFVHPSVEQALREGRTAYLTLDKPGIRAPFADPAALRVTDGELRRYTQGHMVECARRAMTWAQKQFGPAVRFHFRGHSEGTLVALFLYQRLLAEEPEVAARVSTLILSGLGLEPFDELIERQLTQMPAEYSQRLRAALTSCDGPFLQAHLGISCDYLRDAYARPSGRAVFESLASAAPHAKFFVFQGNQDTHTPARYVRDLEAWNSGEGHLDMTFRYYDGAHVGGPEEVQRELSELFVRLTKTAPLE